MSSEMGQLDVALNQEMPLFPYPDQLTDYHFSMNKVFNSKERASHHLQVEFQLISPLELVVRTSSSNQHFILNVMQSHRNLKYHKNPKHPNEYEINLKHYFYVLSRVKYLQEECFMTINYNHFDSTFIGALIKNIEQNDNILSFIQNPKSRKSIIESLEFDNKFGKAMKMMNDYSMFEDLEEHQKIAFYMSVTRNGKSILADRNGKSLTALTIMTYYRDEWPLVIVCEPRRKIYWYNNVFKRYKCGQLFRVSVVENIKDIYVFPKPFHDIMIMDYQLYYEVKDTISFKCLNIKAYIFEDQSRGYPEKRQWKGLSDCVENLQKANRIIFIWAKPFDPNNCRRFWPLLQILDPKTFDDWDNFHMRYCTEHTEHPDIWSQTIMEFQILLRTTFLSCDKPFD